MSELITDDDVVVLEPYVQTPEPVVVEQLTSRPWREVLKERGIQFAKVAALAGALAYAYYNGYVAKDPPILAINQQLVAVAKQ